MPIRPEKRGLYPPDWPQISARIMLRAGGRCECCGVRNGSWGWRDPSGEFHEVNRRALREAGYGRPPFNLSIEAADGHRYVVKIIEIVLTCAHLDNPDPADCRDENLKAMCQRCHLRYDAPMKRAEAQRRAYEAANTRDLFEAV